MREQKKLYSFETPKKRLYNRFLRMKKWLLDFFILSQDQSVNSDMQIFYDRLGISSFDSLSSKEQHIVESFTRTNIFNIQWYSKRIRKEQRKLNLYYFITLVLLIAAPLFIFFSTSKVSSNLLQIDADVLDMENTASIITVVITLILALHQFISTWIDQRKIVVEFSKASVQLKNIYYDLENKFYKNASADAINFQGHLDNQILSDDFLRSLADGTVLSRRVVDEETQNYYQLRAEPTFNIASILENSSGSAKQMFQLFKSNKFKPEEVRSNQKTSEENLMHLQEQIIARKDELGRLMIKLKSNRNAAEKVAQKLEELDARNSIELSENERNLRNKYETEFEALDKANDELDEQYGLIELEIKLLENRITEI